MHACTFQNQAVQAPSRRRKLKLLLSDKEKLEKELTTVPVNGDHKTIETKLKRSKLTNIQRDSLIKVLNDEQKINDSLQVAKQLFQWMISPIPHDTFFRLF